MSAEKRALIERGEAIEEIRRLWDQGIASGPAVDGEEAFARLRAKLAPVFERRR